MEVNGNNERFVAGGGTLSMAILGAASLGLQLLGGGNGGNGVSLLGNGNRLAEAEAEIARLKSEKYTDAATIATQAREAELRALEVKNAEDIAALKKEYELRIEIERQNAKINLLEALGPINAKIDANSATLGAVEQTVGGFTKVYIPAGAVVGKSA